MASAAEVDKSGVVEGVFFCLFVCLFFKKTGLETFSYQGTRCV